MLLGPVLSGTTKATLGLLRGLQAIPGDLWESYDATGERDGNGRMKGQWWVVGTLVGEYSILYIITLK